MHAALRNAVTKNTTLLGRARILLGGLIPTYWLDFQANKACIDGKDVGAIADVPGISGTLSLGTTGHVIASTANVLVMPVTLPYPFTALVKCIRSTDSGFNERVAQLDDGTEAERANLYVSSTDVWRAQHFTASVSDYNGPSGITATVGASAKIASRFQLNNMNLAVNAVRTAADDTACAVNVNPTTLRIGAGVANVEPWFGTVQFLALIKGVHSNAQLQTLTG